MLKIGRIDYANCTPIFHALRELCTSDDYQYISGVPSHLNTLLASGQLDACPSSSFEYALHPERYLIMPQISISSCGPVGSVLLLSHVPIDELDDHSVLLSSESATSVNLLRILLAKKFGCICRYTRTALPFEEALQNAAAVLLIGDTALRASLRKPGAVHVYDMGELWHAWTGLPFVFALWLCTREAVSGHLLEVNCLARRLIEAKVRSGSIIESIALETPEVEWMGKQRLVKYWRENISYDLGKSHLEGLQLFFQFCVELDLLSSKPELCYLQE